MSILVTMVTTGMTDGRDKTPALIKNKSLGLVKSLQHLILAVLAVPCESDTALYRMRETYNDFDKSVSCPQNSCTLNKQSNVEIS